MQAFKSLLLKCPFFCRISIPLLLYFYPISYLPAIFLRPAGNICRRVEGWRSEYIAQKKNMMKPSWRHILPLLTKSYCHLSCNGLSILLSRDHLTAVKWRFLDSRWALGSLQSVGRGQLLFQWTYKIYQGIIPNTKTWLSFFRTCKIPKLHT